MNALWLRAEKGNRLTSLFEVLLRELREMAATKDGEISRFNACGDNDEKLRAYRKDSGLTLDECQRIRREVLKDTETCERENRKEKNAIDGEKSLKSLYCANAGVPVVWTNAKGQQPPDLIVVGRDDTAVLPGDCKFGLRSQDAFMLRNQEEFAKAFSRKFDAVSDAILQNDGVKALPVMLLVVTSAMAPLIRNRMEDYKLDPRYSGIPYGHVVVCSVDDIYSICASQLAWKTREN